ncbi:MAG: putative secreted protein [Candidatus Phytoplasma cynodontis]|nr:MAG: putative secreted protein [Candidatus Phytoplasma cynodontis]
MSVKKYNPFKKIKNFFIGIFYGILGFVVGILIALLVCLLVAIFMSQSSSNKDETLHEMNDIIDRIRNSEEEEVSDEQIKQILKPFYNFMEQLEDSKEKNTDNSTEKIKQLQAEKNEYNKEQV